MALIIENVVVRGKNFTHTFSDSNRFVVRDGISYEDAYDPTEFGRTYTEGDVIPQEQDEINSDEAIDIILGGSE